MEQWISDGISRILDFEVPEDLIKYVISLENEADLEDYLKTLLDFDNVNHKNFYSELVKRKFPGKGNALPKQQKKKISKNKPQQDFVSSNEPGEQPAETKSKKKTKFVNLYSQEGENMQVVLLKGRHHCDCEASKHELVNNCINCGRVVCQQEGSGPCLFCGNLVCTPKEEEEINTKSNSGAKLMNDLMERSRPKGWEAAMAHRDKLLEYDRNSEKRTRVIDDDCDYFNTNSVWLSSSEREKLEKYQQSLQEKKHVSRLQKKMTFDFAGRQIVEDNSIHHAVDEEKIREITEGGGGGSNKSDQFFQGSQAMVLTDRDVAPGVNAPLLQFTDLAPQGTGAVLRGGGETGRWARVQDAELQEISDAGRCLSMHQPWASLLVDGIKLHEGRTWYSSHRGRLWIASTAKPPDQEIVRALENQYRVLYPDKNIQFPSFYPTGCLLGCVNVDDCLAQEEYQKLYPDGESDSPYVFICSNPTSLKLRFPIKGQHKIYTLDKQIHKAAMKSIQTMAKLQAEEASGG